nr:hypothetical protein [Micromonospora sp. DSM 115978]
MVVGTTGRLSTWDVSDLDRPVRRDDIRRTGVVKQVVFGPDGRTLIALVSDGEGDGDGEGDVGGDGASVQLFRVDEAGRTNHVRNFGDAARGAVGVGYVDDARTAVSVRADGTIALWSLADPGSPVRREVLTAQPDATGVVAVAAGDQRLLAVSAGSSVRLWQLDAAAAADAVCARVTEPVSEQQWRYYLPDRDFEPPCG